MDRVRKKGNRPLLNDRDPEGVLRRLLAEREPVYALADIVIASREGPHQGVVAEIVAALDAHLSDRAQP
jgi:shikimate kinase